MGRAVLIFIALAMIAGIILGRLGPQTDANVKTAAFSSKPQKATPSPKQQTPQDFAYYMIQKAKADLPGQLRDPKSAEFRELVAVGTANGDGVIVCGEVNGNNAFGGKSGFQKFIWTPALTLLEKSTEARDFATAWNGTCAKNALLARVR